MTLDRDQLVADSTKRKTVVRRLAYETGRNIIPIVVATIILAATLISLSLWLSSRSSEADRAVAHTVRNHRRLSIVQSLLQDAEIGQRGYLLTGDSFYLEPYDTAVAQISGALDDLAVNMTDNTTQTANVSVLRTLVVQKMSELRQSVQRQREGDHQAAVAILLGGQGKVLMDGVRDVLTRMRNEEEQLMVERARDARHASWQMEMLVIALALFLAAVGLLSLKLMISRTRAAEAARDELLARLDRKLLAVLAADLVGYSALMESNETETLDRLQHARGLIDPLIEEHQGTIVTTAGDSVLAVFSSALSALDCALAIQTAMRRQNEGMEADAHMAFRIGLNVGDVIVQNGDVFGDTVNVAARLEGLAEPGGICITRTVRDHIRKQRNVTFEDLGFQRLKNIAQPISAFRVRQTA
ncbi:adenylate/guanylate cyclase domain-containing protein [Rhizobium rhizosphaerae]|uniref:adenylate/guanylate cyclase domain-containing protein n=1 Tax=Xaviernesmea rhizosphaerae TaxID=1672749 RepID=UPI0013011996|nr:CHASE3 domain-containing protein [Xaviernesmea rhizosphaerae]